MGHKPRFVSNVRWQPQMNGKTADKKLQESNVNDKLSGTRPSPEQVSIVEDAVSSLTIMRNAEGNAVSKRQKIYEVMPTPPFLSSSIHNLQQRNQKGQKHQTEKIKTPKRTEEYELFSAKI